MRLQELRRDGAAVHAGYYPPSNPAEPLEMEEQGRTYDRRLPTAVHSRSCLQSKVTDPATSEMQIPQTSRPVLNLGAEVCLHLILQAEENPAGGVGTCWSQTKRRSPSSQSPVHFTQLTVLYYLNPPTYIYMYGLDPIHCIYIP